MRKAIFLLVLCTGLFSFSAAAQANNIAKTKWHWGNAQQQDTSAGYAQAVVVDNVLYISGSVGMGNDMAAQLKSLYAGIERTLKTHGATAQNVVKEVLYTTDIEATKAANAVRKAFYKGDFPAATWVQISRLYMPQALVEVEVTAHLPKK